MTVSYGTALSRSELKALRGGTGIGFCSYSGTCSDVILTPYDTDDPLEASLAQQAADKWCCANNCCTDVDCPGAVKGTISPC